jgi:hypothetical protein
LEHLKGSTDGLENLNAERVPISSSWSYKQLSIQGREQSVAKPGSERQYPAVYGYSHPILISFPMEVVLNHLQGRRKEGHALKLAPHWQPGS